MERERGREREGERERERERERSRHGAFSVFVVPVCIFFFSNIGWGCATGQWSGCGCERSGCKRCGSLGGDGESRTLALKESEAAAAMAEVSRTRGTSAAAATAATAAAAAAVATRDEGMVANATVDEARTYYVAAAAAAQPAQAQATSAEHVVVTPAAAPARQRRQPAPPRLMGATPATDRPVRGGGIAHAKTGTPAVVCSTAAASAGASSTGVQKVMNLLQLQAQPKKDDRRCMENFCVTHKKVSYLQFQKLVKQSVQGHTDATKRPQPQSVESLIAAGDAFEFMDLAAAQQFLGFVRAQLQKDAGSEMCVPRKVEKTHMLRMCAHSKDLEQANRRNKAKPAKRLQSSMAAEVRCALLWQGWQDPHAVCLLDCVH